MIYINVDRLPSGFKPYKFKSFKMKALNARQAMWLNKSPKLSDLRKLIGELTEDIDANELVSIDLKYLLSVLALNMKPSRSWSLKVTCPKCKESFTKTLGINDFPPIPAFEESDEYPLTIDDGTHVYEMGYASIEDLEEFSANHKDDDENQLDTVVMHVLKIDDSTDKEFIKNSIYELNDMELLNLMIKVIYKYFLSDNTYKELECPKCKESFKLHLSAIEVTNFTPFLEEGGTRQYKTNFRL